MAGYVSGFATGAAIEAVLNKANNSQSVSIAEKTAWNNKQNALTFDTTPTVESSNPVTSEGIYNYIESKIQYATTDILWNDSNGATVGTEYTMSGDINDYDAIYLKISTTNDISLNNTFATTSFLTRFYSTDQGVEWQGYYQRALTAKFDGDKFTQIISVTSEGAGYAPKIYQIIGVKFGTGTNTSTTVKTLTYTGDGTTSRAITFPTTPTLILKISGRGQAAPYMDALNIAWGVDTVYYTRFPTGSSTEPPWHSENGAITYEGNTMTLTTTTSSPSAVFNNTDREYTVLYI